MPDRPATIAREFRLAPEHRRSALYVLVGACLILAVTIAIPILGLAPPPAPPPWQAALLVVGMVVIPAMVLFVAVFRWRLRVDAFGISRRRFHRWQFWPWDAFRNQQIERDGTRWRYKWVIPGVRSRRLELGMLADADRRFVHRVIERIWIPAAVSAPELPPKLTVRYQLRKRIRLTPRGIIAIAGRRHSFHCWADVVRVRIIRHYIDDTEPTEIDLVLPESEILLPAISVRQYQPKLSMELLSRFVQQFTNGAQRFAISLHDPPCSAEEADFRWEKLDRQRREIQKIRRIVEWAGPVAFIFVPFGVLNFWQAKLAAIACWAYGWLFSWSGEQSLGTRLTEIEAWRQAFSAATSELVTSTADAPAA